VSANTGGKSPCVHGVLVAGQDRGRLVAPDQTSARRVFRENAERGPCGRAVRHGTAVLQDPRARLRTGKGGRVGPAETRPRPAVRESDQTQRSTA